MNSLKNKMDILSDLLWTRKIDFKKLYNIVSDLKTNKEELTFLLSSIIEEDFDISKHITQCIKEFGEVFIEVLYESNSDLKVFAGMSENPLAEIELEKIKEDISYKNFTNIDRHILKFMEILCENYYASHKRSQLSQTLKENILNYLKDGDKNSKEYIIKNITKEVYGAAGRERTVMFESDFQLVELLGILVKLEYKSDLVKRYIDIYFSIDPYNFYCKTKFLKYRSYCYWSNDKEIINAFESILHDGHKELLEEFILLYTIEHYNCNKNTHNKVMTYLIDKYGKETLLEKFKPRSDQDRSLGYYLIGEREILNKEEDEKAKKFIEEFKTFKKHDFLPFETLYLSESMRETFIEFVVKKKNSFLYKALIIDSKDINTTPILKNTIDIFIKNNLNIKMFLEYLLKESSNLENSINYLEDNGINCLELSLDFSIKEIGDLLRVLKENSNIKREEKVLKTFLNHENKIIRTQSEEAIKNIGGEIEVLTLDNFNLERFLKDNKIKKNLGINSEEIEYPKMNESQNINIDFVDILLYEFKKEDLFETREKISFLSQFLNKNDLQIFSDNTFRYWSIKKETKEKWLLLISIYYGNEILLKEILKLIDEFCETSRMKLACFILESLSLRKEKWIIKSIDKIKRKSKFKSLKEAATTALENIAHLSGISKYMLSDYLVDDLEFIGNEKKINYVAQNMDLILDDEFNITFKMENGKVLKNPPKIDGEVEKEAKNEIKLIKKALKDEIIFIKEKLQEFYIEHRQWDLDELRKSQENPLLNIAYRNILWGIYSESNLKNIISLDDNITLLQGEKIALVHYSELKNDFKYKSNSNILDQFNFNEVKYEVENNVEIVPEIGRKSPTTVINRLRKKGWSIGSIKDAGHFTEIYKEIKDIDLAIEITFIEHPYIGGFGYEADSQDGLLGIEKIEFYKPGTIKRGSYIYDELRENRYKVSEIKNRVFLEILKEINETFL